LAYEAAALDPDILIAALALTAVVTLLASGGPSEPCGYERTRFRALRADERFSTRIRPGRDSAREKSFPCNHDVSLGRPANPATATASRRMLSKECRTADG
jgi:hypothetical protein